MDVEFASIKNNLDTFLDECTSALSAFPVACVSARDGSVIVTIAGKTEHFLDNAENHVKINGLTTATFGNMAVIESNF